VVLLIMVSLLLNKPIVLTFVCINYPSFQKRFRKLHLYTGLFISPFVLLYAISTLYLNHSVRVKPVDEAQGTVPIEVAAGTEGMDLVNQVLKKLELSGEVAGRGQVRNNQATFRVAHPGTVKVVTVNLLE